MSNVVPLHAPKREPVEAVVRHLEVLLTQARDGKVRSLMYATVDDIGGTYSARIFGDANCITSVGAAHLMAAAADADINAEGRDVFVPKDPDPEPA